MLKLLIAVPLLSIGCGDGFNESVDAALADDVAVVVDAGVDAPASGLVTVTLVNVGTTVAGASVSFADPQGMPTTLTTTNASGVASATVLAGSSVTVVVPNGGAPQLYTILALQPGDELVIGSAPPATPTMLGTSNVDLPSTFAGAASYEVSAACTQNTMVSLSTSVLPLTSECLTAASTYDVVGYAIASGKPIAFTVASDLPPPPNGQVATMTLGSWRTDFDTVTVAATNAPPNSSQLLATLSPLHDGLIFPSTDDAKSIAPAASVGLALSAPKGNWSSYAYSVTLKRAGSASSSAIYQRPAVLPGVVSLDLTGLLPFAHDVSVDMPAGHTTPSLNYAVDGSVAASRGLLFGFNYTDAGGLAANALVIAPPSSPTTVSLPALPDALASNRPGAPFAPTAVVLLVVDGNAWSDRSDFREHWGRVLASTVGAGQTIRVSQAQ